MNFPTCWDDSKGIGDTGDHMSHMAYTVDGTVEGACPEGYNRRLPQIQLFVRIWDYEGGHYTFSDNTLNGDEGEFFRAANHNYILSYCFLNKMTLLQF